MKNRECMYCLYFFECSYQRDERENCIQFKPYNEKAAERHKEWVEHMRKEFKRDI